MGSSEVSQVVSMNTMPLAQVRVSGCEYEYNVMSVCVVSLHGGICPVPCIQV